jgi:hypothetical protein
VLFGGLPEEVLILPSLLFANILLSTYWKNNRNLGRPRWKYLVSTCCVHVLKIMGELERSSPASHVVQEPGQRPPPLRKWQCMSSEDLA